MTLRIPYRMKESLSSKFVLNTDTTSIEVESGGFAVKFKKTWNLSKINGVQYRMYTASIDAKSHGASENKK